MTWEIDPTLLKAIVGGVTSAGVATALVGFLKRSTDRRANEIAERKLLLEVDVADREADRKYREELRSDLKRVEEKAQRLEQERDAARDSERAAKEALALRLYACTEIGRPCQQERKESSNGTHLPVLPPKTPDTGDR